MKLIAVVVGPARALERRDQRHELKPVADTKHARPVGVTGQHHVLAVSASEREGLRDELGARSGGDGHAHALGVAFEHVGRA